MNLDPIAEAFRKCSQFGGNMFFVAFFAVIAIILAIYTLFLYTHS